MKNSIFAISSDCYQVTNIIYAGSVSEIPESKRKNESTHSFRILSSQGPAYCYFKGLDSAKKARGLLGVMMDAHKPSLFRTNGDIIDLTKIVSYSKVIKLKNTDDGFTHAFVVNVDGVPGKDSQIWLTYKSEESANSVRRALFGTIQAANGCSLPEKEEVLEAVNS